MLRKYQLYYALFLAMFFLQGCETFKSHDIDTTRKAIVVANAEVRAANLLLQDLIRRNSINTVQARSALTSLQSAKNLLQTALNTLDTAGDPFTAASNVERANTAITIAITLLAPFVDSQGDST